MLNIKNNKRGMDASGFSVIISIVILLVSGGIILTIIKESSTKVDEKLQVDLCRATNEINYRYIEEKTEGIVSGPQICNTIKKTEGKSQIPTEDYPQNKEGAKSEIREMIKNCWYMWLEGSYDDMFNKMPTQNGCFICYTFKVNEKGGEITLDDIEDSMNEPFFAVPTEDHDCSANGGVLKDKKEECEDGETEVEPKDPAKYPGMKCCLKAITHECENKGGQCSSTGAPDGYPSIYNKWSCPKKDQNCYVKEDSKFSYLRYIREYGAKGGDIYFIPSISEAEDATTEDVEYNPSELYAISFVSPNGKFCLEGEEGFDILGADAPCIATFGVAAGAVGSTGGYIWLHQSQKAKLAKNLAQIDEQTNIINNLEHSLEIGTGADDVTKVALEDANKALRGLEAEREALIAGKRIIPRAATTLIKGVKFIGKAIPKKPSAGTVGVVLTVVGIAYETGVLERLGEKALNFVSSPITDEDQNFIIVTTQEYAQNAGCTIDYVDN